MYHSILFDLGIVLIFGFLSALIMQRIGLSVIIGYIVSGLIIGPFGLKLIGDTEMLEKLSELGVVFLMFFLGLEFSINKFKKIKNAVFFIGTYEIIFNLAIGFLIGLVIGYNFKENLFLACIIALSSSGVVAKLLFDMKKTAQKESEILMGVMVFEDFIAIVLLGILSSISLSGNVHVEQVIKSITIASLFYFIFILLGIFLVNRFIDYLAQIQSQELFTALMLGLILLIGSLSTKLGLASAAGSFLLGMIISSYDVEERLHRTVSAFKDIFLIVFFISFGTLLNPMKIPGILWMIVLIVPITVLSEIFITSSSAFFCGFNSKKSFSIGTSMIARGEYSLIFAAVGLSTGAISEKLYQFTGVYVFAMTLIAPIAMKHSSKIKTVTSYVVPKHIKKRLHIISEILKPLLMPENTAINQKHSYLFLIIFYLFIALFAASFFAKLVLVRLLFTTACTFLTFFLRHLLSKSFQKLTIGNNTKTSFVNNLFTGTLLFISFLPFLCLLSR